MPDAPPHGSRLLALTEEELRRLVLDVHDGPVQYLFAALSQHATVRARLEADAAPAPYLTPVCRTIERVEAALSDIRPTVSAPRAPELAERGLAGLLKELVVGHEARTGSLLELTLDEGIPDVAPAVLVTVYRIAQEAISNVERHSGVAAATVRVSWRQGAPHAEIGYRGRGFDPPPLAGRDATMLPQHIGLRGMRERAALVGGRIVAESASGGGTRVCLTMPADA